MRTTELIVSVIKAIPEGKVASYGQIARMAGLPNGARMVVRVLHSSAVKQQLPWWRVIRSNGEIALSEEGGGAMQRELLTCEGVLFLDSGKVDMHKFAIKEEEN